MKDVSILILNELFGFGKKKKDHVNSNCHDDMEETDTCSKKQIKINGKWYKRNTTDFDNDKRCHDCNIVNKKGNVHHFSCDMETCPRCGEQLIGCDCTIDTNKEFLK